MKSPKDHTDPATPSTPSTPLEDHIEEKAKYFSDGIWDEATKSFTFDEGQYIEVDGSHIDVSGMKVQIDKKYEYRSTAIEFFLNKIKPKKKEFEIIPLYLNQSFIKDEDNLKNAKLIQGEIQKIIGRKPSQSNDDEKTILIPYFHKALSEGKPSDHWSLLALKFTPDFKICEPFCITTSGNNRYSETDVKKGIEKVISGISDSTDAAAIEILDAINIVTMQQNSLIVDGIPTLDCGAYLIQNAENIAAIGLEATSSIDKIQNIEGQNVILRGISLRAKHAIIMSAAPEEDKKKYNTEENILNMIGDKQAAANLKTELLIRVKLKQEEKADLEAQSLKLLEANKTLHSKDTELVSEKQILDQKKHAKILKEKLSELTSPDKSIFFHLGNLRSSSEDLIFINDEEEEINVKREEKSSRARLIITPQIISLNNSKSHHRAEFGGVVFDESEVTKDESGKNTKNGIFNNADLQSANFRGCKFNKIDFSSIDPKVLATISFTNCEFENCNFPEGFKFQQYQFKFKQTDNFDENELTSEHDKEKIPKGIPADKFENKPFPRLREASAQRLSDSREKLL